MSHQIGFAIQAAIATRRLRVRRTQSRAWRRPQRAKRANAGLSPPTRAKQGNSREPKVAKAGRILRETF